MRLCFVVDYRSAIARNWISYFVAQQHEVHVISTYPVAQAPPGLASFTVVPVGYASFATEGVRKYVAVSGAGNAQEGKGRRSTSRLAPALNAVARKLYPMVTTADVWRRRHSMRALIERIQPDVVHAMRIPAEGMLAAFAMEGVNVPLVVSVWGNDFTLYARDSALLGAFTRRTMRRTTALHTDCHRDMRLAAQWGFDSSKPGVVLPGSGGVQLALFQPKPAPAELYARWNLDPMRPVIFNPRNFRPLYVRNDVFFQSTEHVLSKRPDAQFVCIGMAGNPVAEAWRASLPTPAAVRLLPSVTRPQMAELFQLADLSVSPSIHDGTPNTLLEAMACGAYPVAGNIESVREWIQDGVNGSLCDPSDVTALTRAIMAGVESPERRRRAAELNRAMIEERADYGKSMAASEHFYEQVVAGHRTVEPVAFAGLPRRTPSGEILKRV